MQLVELRPSVFARTTGRYRWRRWADFWTELQVIREGGVDDVVDRLEFIEFMLSADGDLDRLRGGTGRVRAEHFSPEVSRATLNAIYDQPLGRDGRGGRCRRSVPIAEIACARRSRQRSTGAVAEINSRGTCGQG